VEQFCKGVLKQSITTEVLDVSTESQSECIYKHRSHAFK